ncbi:MAG: lysophospholipase, partial [Candidatus Hydrogenedentes bacterium]|nr:lysophospholipase [Candidatus Hydrogenedentota bacterium]
MTPLYTRTWKPSAPACAHLLIVHGYGEHSGRYEHLADALTTLGVQVHAYDLRCHGKSPGKRGYITRFETLVDDLANQLEAVRAEAGDMPLFLFAHSMGGLVACNLLSRGEAGIA